MLASTKLVPAIKTVAPARFVKPPPAIVELASVWPYVIPLAVGAVCTIGVAGLTVSVCVTDVAAA